MSFRAASLLLGVIVVASRSTALGQSVPEPSPAAAADAPGVAEGGVSDSPSVSLHDAIARALERSPTVEIARAQVERAAAVVEEVRAGWLPTLAATGTYTRLDSDRLNAGAVVARANQLNLGLGVVVPLVAPQRWSQWSHARDQEEVARSADTATRIAVAAAVTRAYLAVLAQHRIVERLETALVNAQSHVDFTHQRFASGVGPQVDEVRAAQDLATARAQRAQAVTALVQARESLGVLVGVEGPLDVQVEPVALGGTAPVDVRDSLARADDRPDLRAEHARVTAAERVVRDDWVDYMPTVVAAFQAFFQDPPTSLLPQTGWQATLGLVVPLYDGGLRYGAAHERDALLAQERATERALHTQARADVRAAIVEIRQADEALVAAREASRLADETLVLTTTAYRAGATTNLEVVDAQRRARDADVAAIIADDAARQARVDLLVATGAHIE